MRSLLDAHINAEARGKRLLQTNPHTKSYDGGQTAVGDSRSDENSGGSEGRVWYVREGWSNGDIREGNDG